MTDIADLKRRAVHGSAVTFGAQGLRFLVKIATQVLIARLLMPADYGLIAMVMPIMALSQLLGDLGLGQTAIIKHDITQAETSALLWFGLILNCLLAAGLALLSPVLAWLYQEPRVLAITLIMAALLPVTGLTMQHLALLNREMRFARLAAIDVASPACALALGLACARAGWGYWSLIAAVVAEGISKSGLAWVLSGWRPDRPRRFPIRKLLAVGSHLTTVNLAFYVIASLDNILLGAVKGSEALGLYNRGYRLITQSVDQLIAPATRIAVPLLNRLKSDPPHYRLVWSNLLQLMILAGAPGMLWVMLLAPPLVELILGPQWAGVAPIFFWLGLGTLATPLAASTGWLLITQDQTKRLATYVLIASTIAVLSFVAGLPWGPVGVSACASCSFCLVSVPMYCWAATRHGLVRLADIVRAALPMLGAGMMTTAALATARHLISSSGPLSLLAMLILAYTSFAGGLLCLGQPILRRAWNLGRGVLKYKSAEPVERTASNKPAVTTESAVCLERAEVDESTEDRKRAVISERTVISE
jgi:PST family polysaccharide transporter